MFQLLLPVADLRLGCATPGTYSELNARGACVVPTCEHIGAYKLTRWIHSERARCTLYQSIISGIPSLNVLHVGTMIESVIGGIFHALPQSNYLRHLSITPRTEDDESTSLPSPLT